MKNEFSVTLLRLYKRHHSDKGARKRRQIIYRGIECKNCKVRHLCTQQKARTLAREERRGLLEEMRERLLSKEGKEKYKKRLFTVEPPFGNLKHNLGYRSFLLRGLGKVDGEFKLMCIGHNLKKMHLALIRRKEEAIFSKLRIFLMGRKNGVFSIGVSIKRSGFSISFVLTAHSESEGSATRAKYLIAS